MTSNLNNPNATCFRKHHFNDQIARSSALFISLVLWLAEGSLTFVTPAGAGDVTRGENIANAAEKLLTDIRETHYQHRTYVVRSAGIYDMDCSGFVDYLLKRVAPERYADLPIESGHARPRAAMYFDLLNGLSSKSVPGWKSVNPLAAARRGDIIAWALEASTQKVGDTGHVVIVAEPPVKIGGSEYNIAVYDSSGIPHNDDSRPKATSGIGKGVITFKVDNSGIPVGFQFNSHARFHLEPIAIGRIVDSSSSL